MAGESRAAQRFAHFTDAVVQAMPKKGPFAFLSTIEPTLVGFLILSASGFLVDVAFLALFVRLLRPTSLTALGLTYPISVTLGYLIASAYNFVVNKVLNFQAHGQTVAQSTKWTVVAVSNYLLWILGLSWLLEHNGVDPVVARMLVIIVEVPWLYLLARWWVFRGGTRAPALADLGAATFSAPASQSDRHPGRPETSSPD